MVSLMITNAYAANGKVSEHFYYKEYSCKCCGETKINIELIIALEKLRVLVNKPIMITSGYRCSLHNKAIGGAKNSQHMFGNAVDIKVNGFTPLQISKLAKECGFTWTKVYSSWTHIDVRR
jgi:uncharacterized protein YcbK (DUF882 family)